MTPPVPARCDGCSVLAQVAEHPCPRQAPNVLAYVCAGSHGASVRACEPHAQRIMSGQDAKPATVCPECGSPAWFAIYCGRCRSGRHDECRALRVTTLPPLQAEGYCACSCDPYGRLVPGVPGAPEHVEATR